MQITPLKIGEKIASVPIIQGGMGVGISLGNLAGHVAKEGGVGVISAAQIGFLEPDFEENSYMANLRAIGSELKKARDIAPDGIIGYNIMVALNHYEDYVREAAHLGADIIISGAGLPTELPAYVKGTNTSIAPIVSTAKSAEVILKYWSRKHKCTADCVVIEGPQAGGHLGFTKDQLAIFDQETYQKEIEKILEVVQDYEEQFSQSIPVVLAGGIDTGEKVWTALKQGMAGVQVGSRFVTTVECDAHERYKQVYLEACQEDVQIVSSPVGMPGRAFLNDFMKRVLEGESFPPKKCLGCLRKCNPKEIPYCITERLLYAAKGQVEEALLFCGKNGYKQKKIETVKEVIESLMKE